MPSFPKNRHTLKVEELQGELMPSERVAWDSDMETRIFGAAKVSSYTLQNLNANLFVYVLSSDIDNSVCRRWQQL